MQSATTFPPDRQDGERAELIRLRGQVQGVGLRPAVWRLACRHGLRGAVWNDGQGAAIHVCGGAGALAAFLHALEHEVPAPALIQRIERAPADWLPRETGFRIGSSVDTASAPGSHAVVAPDLAACTDCVQEVFNPAARRFRYPFTNCTACGPRLSIIEAIPYDRASTTMRRFAMCADCAREYGDPADRRFHAQPIACHACGPKVWLELGATVSAIAPLPSDAGDGIEQARALLRRGLILAIKGLGGFQLACDAGDGAAVSRLRERKRRECKPFALMVRDIAQARCYAAVSEAEEALLRGPAAPIVLLDASGAAARLAAGVAPGVRTLGMMLPATPLHLLLMQGIERPIVLTSGNLSDEPQCIANDEARLRLAGIADAFLLHDRDVVRRIDDSVVRVVAGAPAMLRRARGYAAGSLPTPPGLEVPVPVLAMGAELKNTFCLLRSGGAIVSHHMGDLENAPTQADFRRSVEQYLKLMRHAPGLVAVDLHPDYLSSRFGEELARAHGAPLIQVQHHHAHAAACLADNGVSFGTEPVLAVVLDGLGYGEGDEWWGGEFMLADYLQCRRVATLRPVALPGGAQAMREPWRNTYAQLAAGMGWEAFSARYSQLDLHRFLAAQPREALDRMQRSGLNSPLASSCGRLFDAVAAAAGLCRERAWYEGQGAIELEALVDGAALRDGLGNAAYPFGVGRVEPAGLPCIEPAPLWPALLDDMAQGTPAPVISARFHLGLAEAIACMAGRLAGAADRPFKAVALSGGVFQNRLLLEQVLQRLRALGLQVLAHRRVPCNDGGLSLGQAVVAAARWAHDRHGV